MIDKVKKIESLNYLKNNSVACEYWEEKIKNYLPENHIDNMTDLNYSTCFTYLITLNPSNESFYSESFQKLLERDNAYFYEILISTEKPLITMHFWKYPKGSGGQILNVSEKNYLKEHNSIYEKCIDFANENGLIVLGNIDLKREVYFNGEKVSLYYKYFNQEDEDKLKMPY